MNDLENQLAAATRSEEAHQNTEASVRAALAYLETVADTVREPMLVLDGTLRVKTASEAFCHTFGVSRQATVGQFIYDLGNGQWNIPALSPLLETVLANDMVVNDFEVSHEFPTIGKRLMLLNAKKLLREPTDGNLVVIAIEDVTERKRIQYELVRSNEDLRKHHMSTS